MMWSAADRVHGNQVLDPRLLLWGKQWRGSSFARDQDFAEKPSASGEARLKGTYRRIGEVESVECIREGDVVKRNGCLWGRAAITGGHVGGDRIKRTIGSRQLLRWLTLTHEVASKGQ